MKRCLPGEEEQKTVRGTVFPTNAFGLAVGLGSVGFGADMLEVQLLAGRREGEGFIA